MWLHGSIAAGWCGPDCKWRESNVLNISSTYPSPPVFTVRLSTSEITSISIGEYYTTFTDIAKLSFGTPSDSTINNSNKGKYRGHRFRSVCLINKRKNIICICPCAEQCDSAAFFFLNFLQWPSEWKELRFGGSLFI